MKKIVVKFSKCLSILTLGLSLLGLPVSFAQESAVPKLNDLKTFEVEQFHGRFSNYSRHLEAEYYTHLTHALSQERSLQSKTPAEGVIHLSCANLFGDCYNVKVSVTAGQNGPEVWSTKVGNYDLYTSFWFGGYEKGPKRVAKLIIQQLAKAYQQDPQLAKAQ